MNTFEILIADLSKTVMANVRGILIASISEVIVNGMLGILITSMQETVATNTFETLHANMWENCRHHRIGVLEFPTFSHSNPHILISPSLGGEFDCGRLLHHQPNPPLMPLRHTNFTYFTYGIHTICPYPIVVFFV